MFPSLCRYRKRLIYPNRELGRGAGENCILVIAASRQENAPLGERHRSDRSQEKVRRAVSDRTPRRACVRRDFPPPRRGYAAAGTGDRASSVQRVMRHNAATQHPTSHAGGGAAATDITGATVWTGAVPAGITIDSRRRTGAFNSDYIVDNATAPLNDADCPYL